VSRRARRIASAAAGVAAVIALAGASALPSPLFDAPTSPVLLDARGELLGASIARDEQWRFPPVERAPERFARALVRAEDRRFRRHPGVDALALARAVVRNARAGRVVSGASTLTMQVVRLARGSPPRTYREKLVEIAAALWLDARASKDEILAHYASHAPFGGNVVGVEAAAWRYFGRAPDALSWAEACTLAVLPNEPALVHPGRNRERLRSKRDALLRGLASEGAIDSLELELALREPLPDAPTPLPRLAPHLLATLTVASDALGSGERRFATTLRRADQARASALVESHGRRLAAEDVHDLAALVVDNRSFEVVAYVGNRDTSRADEAGEHGHAVDIVRRPRSTGSILKPFLYALAFERGLLLPDTLVEDVPTRYAGFAPENFDRRYRGAVRAREALAQSLNVPAVRLLGEYGVARFQRDLERLGMSTLHRAPDEYGLTLVLGGAEATLFELAQMYANLARLAGLRAGEARTPGRLRLQPGEAQPREAAAAPFGPGAAWLALDALGEVARPETEGDWTTYRDAKRIAWKTGTSYGLRDAWAIGATPEYTVAVWAGNANGRGVAGLSGSHSAAPLLFDLFRTLDTAAAFEPPIHDLASARVCRDDGFLANDLCDPTDAWKPRASHFAKVTPYHRSLAIERASGARVDSRCADVAEIEAVAWFALPPAAEAFYRAQHPTYRPLPPLRAGCDDPAAAPIALLYPSEGASIYVPVRLDGTRSAAVFEAAHRDDDAVVHWHLDDTYLGRTRSFHQMAVAPAPGAHVLTLVDASGATLERRFRVLAREGATPTNEGRVARGGAAGSP